MLIHSKTYGVEYRVLRDGVPLQQRLRAFADEPAQVRMTAESEIQLTLDGSFDAIPPGVNFLRDKLAPYLLVDGQAYPLGVYTVTTTETETDENGVNYVALEAYGQLYEVQSSAFEQVPVFAAGRRYVDVVEQLLVESGIVDYAVEPSDAVLRTARDDWGAGDSRLKAANTLLAEIGYRPLWEDLTGRIHAGPRQEPDAGRVQHIYREGDGVLLRPMGGNSDRYSRCNVFVVHVDNPEGDAMTATAINDDGGSPISVQNLGKRMVKVVRLDNVASQAHLQAYADNLVMESRRVMERYTFSSAAEPGHGVLDTVAIDRAGLVGLFDETAWGLRLGGDYMMQHEVERAVY